MKYDNFINGILDDYTYCREHDAFVSCKDIVEVDLEEAFWDDEYGNKWRHYQKHVCAEGEKFTGIPSDNFKRIKFPHMPFGKYLGNAERLADTTPVLSEVSDERVFGWKTTVGWLKDDVCVKFKKTDLTAPDGQELYEYVAYTIINGKPVVREINGVNFTYYEIVDRRVFSYGLSLHPTADFKKVDTLSPLELEEALVEKRVYKLTPELLTEANRQYLLQKSRKGRDYAPSNQYKGRNRFERRTKSSISATVKDYNMIQMDPLFKRDILEFKIPVLGETDVYTVDVRVDGLLSEIRKQLMNNKGELEFKVVLQSLMRVLNMGDVYIGCNCLHPDTKIKLLDGTTPTVKEMCERFDNGETLWVYSTDENGDFKPGQVERVWKTGEATDFIKITLDNGEEIITTPEHPYMLRDGTYTFACDLKEGQSLMPMYFNYNNDYEQVKLNTEVRGWRSIYKLVAEALKSDEIQDALSRVTLDDNMSYAVAIHHKDFNKHNNNPDNLEIMTAREHWDYHASLTWENKPEDMKQHIIEAARKNAVERNNNPTDNMIKSRKEWQEKGRLRNYDGDRKQQQSAIAKKYLVPNRHEFTAEELSERSKTAWKNGCFNTDKFHATRVREGKRLLNNKDNQLKMRKAKMLKVLQQMLDTGIELTEDNYNRCRLKTKASKAEDVFGSFNAMIEEFQLNHKVIKVERIVLDSTSVYDIKVKEWENFVVDAGVVLHNCPDARYRQAYYQTKNNYKAGYKERRPSDKTNPNDDLGAGCKHVLLILANLDWCVKVASVINNYIKYCKEHLQKNYADYIFPKIYGVKYDKAVQLQLFDNGLFPEDQKTMQDVIGQGFRGKDDKGKFVKGNEFRFQPKPKEEPGQEDENPLDLKFNPNEPEEVAEESLQEDVSVGNDLEDNSILELDVGKSIFQPSHIKGVFRISNYSSFEDLCNKYNISLYREDLEDSGFNFNKNSFILKYFKSKIYSLNSIFEQISLNDDAGVVIDIISDRGVPSPGFVKLQKSEFENFKDELGITEIIDQHYRYNDLEEDITANTLTLDPEECRSYLVNYIASKIGNCVVKDNAIFYIDEDFCIYEGDDDRDVEKGIFFIINVTPDTIDICFPNYATSIEWEHINDYPLKHFLAGCEYVKSCYTFRAFVECIDNYMGRGWFGIDNKGNDFWDNDEDTAENSNENNIYDYLKAYNLYC